MGAIREFERNGWQVAASSYDGFAAATRLFVPALLAAAGVKPGLRLLDLACGPGLASGAAIAAGARVVGIDFSPAMIAIARGLHPAADYAIADAEDLPVRDAGFDAVIANFGIHHFERPGRAIAEVRRVVRAGGIFAFTFWAEAQHNTAWRLVFDAIAACGRTDVAMPAGNDGPATPENFSRLAKAAGFAAVRCDQVSRDWMLPAGADLVSIFETGTVRMATLLRGQGKALAEIRRKVAEDMRQYLRDGRIVLPTQAWLLVAKTEEAS